MWVAPCLLIWATAVVLSNLRITEDHDITVSGRTTVMPGALPGALECLTLSFERGSLICPVPLLLDSDHPSPCCLSVVVVTHVIGVME